MQNIDRHEIFKQIKKQNGEKFAQVIRGDRTHGQDFCLIPGIVHMLEFAGNNPKDAAVLRNVLQAMFSERARPKYVSDKNPLELLNDAGYDAFVVKTEQEKNSIKKYFRPHEALCTFNDPERHLEYYIIHAVKRGADKIEPAQHPDRQDEYGTSVISIQILKTGGFISIKNRYNHTVYDPDATFNNNPDNIISGLTDSLRKFFNVDFDVSNASLPRNFRLVHNQFVRFNYEINDVYFGKDYYFRGSDITKLNSDYEFMLDYFVLNNKTGKISNPSGACDSAYEHFNDILSNKKIQIQVEGTDRLVYADNQMVIRTDKNNVITELNLPNVPEIKNDFLMHNNKLSVLRLPDAVRLGHGFLTGNQSLCVADLPKVETIGDWFLMGNEHLAKINAPAVIKVGNHFLHSNRGLTDVYFPRAVYIGDGFLPYNKWIKKLVLSDKIRRIGDNFMPSNQRLSELNLPNVEEIGSNCLENNTNLANIYLPNVTKIGDFFATENQKLTNLSLPNLQQVGDCFLCQNVGLSELNLPNLVQAGDDFLQNNHKLTRLVLPHAKNIGDNCLCFNTALNELDLPEITNIGKMFLYAHSGNIKINMPNMHDEKILSRFRFNAGKQKLTNIELFKIMTQTDGHDSNGMR